MGSIPLFRTSALHTNVAEVLRNSLLSGRFQPGEDLNDMELAREFGVSRGPVREALLGLVKEGLVEHIQNRGFRILRLTEADIRQMIQARFPLEVVALELAKEAITPGGLERLRTLKQELVSVFETVGISGCARVELEFHSTIWSMTGNPWMEAALRRVAVPYFVYVSAFRLYRSDLTAHLFEEQHDQYLDYLAGVSALSARETVEGHLTSQASMGALSGPAK